MDELIISIDSKGNPYILCTADTFSDYLEDKIMEVFITKALEEGVFIQNDGCYAMDRKISIRLNKSTDIKRSNNENV